MVERIPGAVFPSMKKEGGYSLRPDRPPTIFTEDFARGRIFSAIVSSPLMQPPANENGITRLFTMTFGITITRLLQYSLLSNPVRHPGMPLFNLPRWV